MSFKVEVISLAFIELGEKPINDIDTGNPIHAAAAQVFDVILGNELNTSQPWRFAMVLQKLSLLTEKPLIDRWENIFQIPTDPVFKMIYRLYGDGLATHPPFDIFQDKLFSNETGLIMEYVSEPADQLFPSSFKLMLAYKLASSIAFTVTQQTSISARMDKKAFTHEKLARAMDSRSTPNRTLRPGRSFLAHLGGGIADTLRIE